MESMTAVCLLRDFAGCRWQAKRQLQAMVKLVNTRARCDVESCQHPGLVLAVDKLSSLKDPTADC